MIQFRIDPEFQNKIPPISEDEYKQLRENILAAGEVYEPLVVWDGVLVDGHNRWKIIQENPSVKYNVREMHFPDKWAAFEWMYKNQLGRRNLTDEQRTYTIGKMYEARKNTRGGDRRSKEFSNAQNEHLKNAVTITDKETHGVSGEMAIELNIARNTVRRSEHFAKGVDALREVSPEAADKVLSGKAKTPKRAIAGIAKMERSEVEAAAENILSDKTLTPEKPTGSKKGYDHEMRELNRTIEKAYAPMIGQGAATAYTINDLVEEITVNGKDYAAQLHRTIENRRCLIDTPESKMTVQNAINTIVKMIAKEMHLL